MVGSSRCDDSRKVSGQRGLPTSALGICLKRSKIKLMPAVATASMIRREIGDDQICVLTFDRPESGANIFDAATLDELNENLDFVEHEESLRGLIIASAKKSIFVAGADLKTLLQQAQSGDMREFIAKGQRIFGRLANLKIPTVAAIHGASAGGGYEVALACDYRIASDDPATRIGLPETTLGLIPAWGGCTRLPRLIGAEKAADVILKGKLYSAQEALKLGLLDESAPRDQLIHRAKERLRVGKRKMEGGSPGTPASLAPPRQHGNPAPERACQIINKTLSISPDESSRMELEAIVELGKTESTQNLIRNFFLAEKYKKGSSRTPAERVIHAAVIGAGVMGSGIAQWLSSRGVTVILRDIAREQIDRGLANIEKIYSDAVKRGLMTEEKAKEGRARICGSTAPMELRDAAQLFEAGVEAEKIDSALVQWGMPMGPLRLIDEIGVDIAIDIGNTLEKAYGRRDHVSAVLLWLRDGQMLGRKSGAGFYKYEGKVQAPNDSLTQWRSALHGELERAEGPNPATAGPDRHRDPRLRLNEEALAHRLVFLMVNEAARCVEEKVVDSPEDADYGMILGTGFAPFRGGPLRFAEHFGLSKIVDELERLAQSEEKFSPCEILRKHARESTKFYEN